MQGFARAGLRLAMMALVTGAVLITAIGVGLPAAAVLGISLTVTGLAGMLGMTRRAAEAASPRTVPVGSTATSTVAIPSRAPARAVTPRAVAPRAVPGRARGHDEPVPSSPPHPAPDPDLAADDPLVAAMNPGVAPDPLVAAMAPGEALDPEMLMPRWRRPSLLAARHSDPTRVAHVERPAMRFAAPPDTGSTRRIVRYAVVPILDRPDEVLGRQVVDLVAGDEVEVLQANGSFWEVVCPDGVRGWVHRTTLGTSADGLSVARRVPEPEQDDLLAAVLTARGIQ